MRSFRVLSTVLSLLLGTGLLAAQGGGMGGGRHGGGGRRGGGGGYSGHSAPTDLIVDPVVWDGPPSFAELPATIQLSAEQKDRYNAVYDTFMLATKQVRDQARVNRAALNGGPSPLQGGSDAAGGGVAPSSSVIEDLKSEGSYLEEKQAVFDKSIQTLFSKAQMKEYKKWRKAQRKSAEAEQHQGGGGGMRGRGRPPS